MEEVLDFFSHFFRRLFFPPGRRRQVLVEVEGRDQVVTSLARNWVSDGKQLIIIFLLSFLFLPPPPTHFFFFFAPEYLQWDRTPRRTPPGRGCPCTSRRRPRTARSRCARRTRTCGTSLLGFFPLSLSLSAYHSCSLLQRSKARYRLLSPPPPRYRTCGKARRSCCLCAARCTCRGLNSLHCSVRTIVIIAVIVHRVNGGFFFLQYFDHARVSQKKRVRKRRGSKKLCRRGVSCAGWMDGGGSIY